MDKIPVIRGQDLRDDTPTVIGVMQAGVLIKYQTFAIYQHEGDRGYQREPDSTRVRKLAKALQEQEADLPTAVLLSLRVEYQKVVSESKDGNLILTLDPSKVSGEHALYIVDGQHRVRALEKAIRDENDDPAPLRAKLLPFVCMIGASEHQEMNQFHIVNSSAKSIDTGLALELLKERAKLNMVELRSSTEWKVRAIELVKKLARENDEWKGKIRFPNKAKGATTVQYEALINSMHPLFKRCAIFESASDNDKYRIIETYWKGVKIVLPEPFAHSDEYNIQTSFGTKALHEVLRFVIEHISSRNKYSPNSYAEILRPVLTQLSGENRDGVPVKGADFWRKGKEGGSDRHTNAAGTTVLAGKLKSLLPERS